MITDNERKTLTELIARMRAIAEPVGPLHGWWDNIFDYECLLRGERMMVPMTISEATLEANDILNK